MKYDNYDIDFSVVTTKVGGSGGRKNGSGRHAKKTKQQNQSNPSIYSSKHVRRQTANKDQSAKAPKVSHKKIKNKNKKNRHK